MTVVALTKDNFRQTIDDNDFVIVDFWASWCPPCRSFAPTFEKVSDEFPNVVFGKVSTEEECELASEFSISAIPTLMIFRGQDKVYSESGALPESALRELLNKVAEGDLRSSQTLVDTSRDALKDFSWPDGFNTAHALGCLYLTFAVYTDDVLDPKEFDVIKAKLAEWPFVDDPQQTMEEVNEFWMGLTREQTVTVVLGFVCDSLKNGLEEKGRWAVYEDLCNIAKADGRIVEREVEWLSAIKVNWGLVGNVTS